MNNQENNQTIDPGRTPGSAEGVPQNEDQSQREPQQTARTPDQAEGEDDPAETGENRSA